MVIHFPALPRRVRKAPMPDRVMIKRHPRGKVCYVADKLVRRVSSQCEARRLFSEAGLPTYRTPEGTITKCVLCIWWNTGVTRSNCEKRQRWPSNLTSNTAAERRIIRYSGRLRKAPPHWIPMKYSRFTPMGRTRSPTRLPATALKRCISPNR